MINPRGKISQALANLKANEGVSLTINALAQQLNLNKDFLYRLDDGQAQRVDLKDIDRLCLALKITPNDLLGFKPDDATNR
jgi:DNA-binding Xre family transcriptional regulator